MGGKANRPRRWTTGRSLLKTNEQASKQTELSCDPEIPLLRNYPKMMETLSERQLCPFTAALFTTATGEDNLSARLWMNGTEKHGLHDRTALSSTGRHPAVRDSTDGPRGRRGERNEPEEDKPCAPPPPACGMTRKRARGDGRRAGGGHACGGPSGTTAQRPARPVLGCDCGR